MACSVRFRVISRMGRFCLVGVVIACLGLSGCPSVNPPPEKSPASASQSDLSNMARTLRPTDSDSPSLGWSDKAKDIERDLGVAGP
jgi:hypothetical protein